MLALALLLGAGITTLLIIYPTDYVCRLAMWGDADVGDQYRFPRRAIAHRPGSTDPPAKDQSDRVRRAFAAARPTAGMDTWLAEQGTLAFVVMQHGTVIHESYFEGVTRSTPLTSFSIAKSILSALFIAAQSDGHIGGLDAPLTRYVPELLQRDERFARITLRHLLNMQSGIAYREVPFFNGDNAKTYYWPDLRELALWHTRVTALPGGDFVYNNYHPLLLGLVLERATRMPVAQYLAQRLWQPAGLGAGASWSLDSDASAFEKLESGVNARALDFARFGQLFLDGGLAADGTRVLPEAAVREATSYDGAVPLDFWRSGLAYKQFWWIQRRDRGNDNFSARGNHGQFVFVSPAAEVVIARLGSRYGQAPGQWMDLFERMSDELQRSAER